MLERDGAEPREAIGPRRAVVGDSPVDRADHRLRQIDVIDEIVELRRRHADDLHVDAHRVHIRQPRVHRRQLRADDVDLLGVDGKRALAEGPQRRFGVPFRPGVPGDQRLDLGNKRVAVHVHRAAVEPPAGAAREARRDRIAAAMEERPRYVTQCGRRAVLR